jgi:hypothetical protein
MQSNDQEIGTLTPQKAHDSRHFVALYYVTAYLEALRLSNVTGFSFQHTVRIFVITHQHM